MEKFQRLMWLGLPAGLVFLTGFSSAYFGAINDRALLVSLALVSMLFLSNIIGIQNLEITDWTKKQTDFLAIGVTAAAAIFGLLLGVVAPKPNIFASAPSPIAMTTEAVEAEPTEEVIAPTVDEELVQLIDQKNQECQQLISDYDRPVTKSSVSQAFPEAHLEYLKLGNWKTEGDTGSKLYLETLTNSGDELILASMNRQIGQLQTWFYLVRPNELKTNFLGAVPGAAVLDLVRNESNIFASYMTESEGCYKVGVAILNLEGQASLDSIFVTRSCAQDKDVGIQHGGRLSITDRGEILLAVGDFRNGASSMKELILNIELDSDFVPDEFGAVHTIDPLTGKSSLLSFGHRNQQGMAIDSWGQVWVSEHGPLLGSEINKLRTGSDYGWPFYTFGKPYDLFNSVVDDVGLKKRFSLLSQNHDLLARWCNPGPAEIGKPEVLLSGSLELAPSQLIMLPRILNSQKMILGSLAGESLLIFTIADTQLKPQVEIVRFGERIRDMTMDSTRGTLWITSDVGDILSISPLG